MPSIIFDILDACVPSFDILSIICAADQCITASFRGISKESDRLERIDKELESSKSLRVLTLGETEER